MSLYEVSAHLFYGVRIQRMGRCADAVLPLGSDVHVYSHVQEILIQRGIFWPDWYAEAKRMFPNPKDQTKLKAAAQDPTHELGRLWLACETQRRALTFGCELLQMGSEYDADDWVIYAAITESRKSCGSEDDHGGFGEKSLDPESLVSGADWDERLSSFCELLGVPLGKPRWTLSMRG